MDILSDFGDSKKINNFYPSIQLQNNYFECNNHSTEIIEGPEIKYILNKQGFRSQDFDNFNKDNYNILVAGDSFTYGDGLPYDCTWHQILKNNFFKKNVEVFNQGNCKKCFCFYKKVWQSRLYNYFNATRKQKHNI